MDGNGPMGCMALVGGEHRWRLLVAASLVTLWWERGGALRFEIPGRDP